MKIAGFLLAFALSVASQAADEKPAGKDTAVRKTQFGKIMTPHQMAVEDLAKKHFGAAYTSIAHSVDEKDSRDNIEVTCQIPRSKANAAKIQKDILSFTAAYHLAGFDSSHLAFTYETWIPDDLGNDKLTALINAMLYEGLANRANWKAPDKIRFHAIFSAKGGLESFREEWEGTGAATQ